MGLRNSRCNAESEKAMNLDEIKAAERSLGMTHKEINELLFAHTLPFDCARRAPR